MLMTQVSNTGRSQRAQVPIKKYRRPSSAVLDAPDEAAMDPLTSIATAATSSDVGVAVLKMMLDSNTASATALISKCLDPKVGQSVDLRL
jgi:hypothetical protein